MRRLFAQITIGENTFRTVTQVDVNTSWKTLTDTAVITVARRFQRDGEVITTGDGIFSRGDKVVIKFGYFPQDFTADPYSLLPTIFTGYVSSIENEYPVKIYCQDESYILKQGGVQIAQENTTVKVLIDEMFDQLISANSEYSSEITTIKNNAIYTDSTAPIGSYRTKGGKIGMAAILSEIKKIGFQSFFQNGNFYCMFAGPRLQENREYNTHNIRFERNIPEHSLKYQNANDVRITVIAKCLYYDNKKIEVTVGDQDGETRTLTLANVLPNSSEKQQLAAIRQLAESEKDRFKYDGFDGEFTTFAEPFIQHSDRVQLESLRVPERNGLYIVDSVRYYYGVEGIRQYVELGYKIQ